MVQYCDIPIYCIPKPQSALYSDHQLQQASRDKLHIKTAPDEIWSVLIVSGSTECLILLAAASDDIRVKLYLTRSLQPEYLYKQPETQGDLFLNGCSLLSHCVARFHCNRRCIFSVSIMLSVYIFRSTL